MTPFAHYESKIRVETFPGAACYKTLGNATPRSNAWEYWFMPRFWCSF